MARRKLPPLTAEREAALASLAVAVQVRRAADAAYVAAILAAAGTGLTPTQIAPSAGSTRQAVEQMVARHAT